MAVSHAAGRAAGIEGADDARLQTLRDSGLLEADDTEPFDRLARLTRRLLNVDTALISLVGEERQVFKGQDGVRPDLAPERGSPLSHSYCKFAVATGEPLVVNDARRSPLLHDSPAITERDAVAYAGIPLRLGADGDVMGTLCVVESQAREWTEGELATLAELAEVARTELDYRVKILAADQVEELALRLPEPVNRLGDAVRSTASMVEQPDDPRLPRTADVARGRFKAVETISEDLARAAGAQRTSRRPQVQTVDLRERLAHAVDLALSNARPEDITVELPPSPVSVEAIRGDVDRALSLAVVTATHHAQIGSPTEVTLRAEAGQALLRVHCPVNSVPVAELLRVVGAFQHGINTDALDVAVRSTGTRVRGRVAEASVGPSGTTLEAQLPLTQTQSGALGATEPMGRP